MLYSIFLLFSVLFIVLPSCLQLYSCLFIFYLLFFYDNKRPELFLACLSLYKQVSAINHPLHKAAAFFFSFSPIPVHQQSRSKQWDLCFSVRLFSPSGKRGGSEDERPNLSCRRQEHSDLQPHSSSAATLLHKCQ